MSGGRSTAAHAKGKRLAAQAGDISSVHPMGNALINEFLIECKTYRDLDYVGLLSDRGHLVKFWLETKHQAKRYGKKPMLIAKQNQQPTTICLGYDATSKFHGSPIIEVPRLCLCIMLFDEFLKNVRPGYEQRPKRHRTKLV